MAEGQSVGVTGTPAFIINGRKISGAQPFQNFKAVIDDELRALRRQELSNRANAIRTTGREEHSSRPVVVSRGSRARHATHRPAAIARLVARPGARVAASPARPPRDRQV